MFNHAPDNYVCPFCIALGRIEDDRTLTRQSDFVYRGEKVVAWISPHWWPKSPAHVLVVPVEHIENLYEIPKNIGAEIFDLSRRVAIAMKEVYGCDGVSTRQHNEPAGYQDVWHFHQHVFPRWRDDHLYRELPLKQVIAVEERKPFAEKLRAALVNIH